MLARAVARRSAVGPDTRTLPDGTVENLTFTATGRPDTVTVGMTTLVGFGYDDGGRETSRTFGNSLVMNKTYRLDNSLDIGGIVIGGSGAAGTGTMIGGSGAVGTTIVIGGVGAPGTGTTVGAVGSLGLAAGVGGIMVGNGGM